jgi:hypothetical protein
MNRLNVLRDQDAAGLAEKLESLPLAVRRNILARACLAASECLTDLGPLVQNLLRSLEANRVLSPDEATEAKRLADAADAAYLESDQAADHDKALKFFSEARLLNAMALGFGQAEPRDAPQAVYEICKTCDDATRLVRLIESDVRSALWNEQLERLTALAEETRNTTSSALGLFLSHEDLDDWLMIDRALLIATSVRDSMQSTFSKLGDVRKRRVIAVALFELGDMSVVPDLVDAVENDPDLFMLAANKLASKSIREAAPAILRRLELSYSANATIIATLLGALCRVSDEVPLKTYNVLKAKNFPEIDKALSRFKRKS